MATLAELVVKIGSDVTGFDDGIKGINQKARKLGDDLTVIGAGLTAGITVPLVGAATAAIMAGDKFEQASIGFTTMLGSAERAKSFLDELKDFAATTPFEFPELITAAQRMMAYGFAAEQVIPTLTNVGDAAAALGTGTEGMNRIIVALGQMSAAGKVTAQDMRQLTEAGIPAWKFLAEAIGTDVAGAMDKVKDRAVSAEVGIAAITKGMNEAFGGLMANQMQTFSGQLSNIKDQLFFIAQDLGGALLPVAKDLLENVVKPMVDSLKEWTRWFAELDPATQRFAVGLAAVAAAAGPVLFVLGSIIKTAASFGAGISAVSGLGSALAAFATGPVGLTIAGLAALYTGMSILLDRKREVDAQFEARAELQGYLDKLSDLGIVMQQQTGETWPEYAARIKETAAEFGLVAKSADEAFKAFSEYDAARQKQKALSDQAHQMLEKMNFELEKEAVKQREAAREAELHAAQVELLGGSIKTGSSALETYDAIMGVLGKTTKATVQTEADLEKAATAAAKAKAKAATEAAKAEREMAKLRAATEKVKQEFIELNWPLLTATEGFNSLSAAGQVVFTTWGEVGAAIEAARPSLRDVAGDVEIIGEVVTDSGRAMEAFKDATKVATGAGIDLSGQAEKYGGKAKKAKEETTEWGRAVQQMSTIVSDFGKNFGSAIFDLFSIGDFNRDLEAQADAFRDSLAERQADMEQWRDDHAATLADMTEDFNRSVEDRQASFDEFVTDSTAKFNKFRDDLAKREAQDLKNLEKQTSDKEDDFGDYVEDSEKKIEKIRQKEKESMEDATWQFNDNLRERERDFAQYEVEMERKILFASGKEKANLKATLEAKRQDLADWIEDNRIALERKAFEEKRDADASVAEEKERLARRTAQHQEFLNDQKAKAEEIRAANAEKLAEQEADLAASLAKKNAELDKWKTEANAKYAEDVVNHNARLDEKEADYQKYIDGINGKLDELADKHKTVWGEIGGLVKETILGENGFAGAITRFVGEYLVGKLFKELGKLADVILPGIAGKLAGIFGGGASAAGGAAGSAGGAAGSAGGVAGGAAGAAGGIMGTLGAIGSIGSMISGIIGNFQSAKMETTLNAIEESTRRSMIHLGEGGSSILDWTQELAKIGWLQFGSQQGLLEASGPLWSSFTRLGELNAIVRDETNAKLDRIASALEALAGPQSSPVQIALNIDGEPIYQNVTRRLSRRLALA